MKITRRVTGRKLGSQLWRSSSVSQNKRKRRGTMLVPVRHLYKLDQKPVLHPTTIFNSLRDKLPCLCNMSSFSPATYISELDDRFRCDEGLDTLQETDIVALNLVRRALSTRDLFAVILVRNRRCALFKHRRVLTRYRKPRSTMQWFHLLWFPPRLTYIRWRMAWIWFATSLRFQR